MDIFKESIDNQFKSNKGKNFFNESVLSTLCFNDDTLEAIRKIGLLEENHEMLLIEYVTNKAIKEFCRVNQYYNFNLKARNELKQIYSDLLLNLRINDEPVSSIAEKHYRKLTHWIKSSNPFADKIFNPETETVIPVPCSEYSPELQIKLLQIDITQIEEPLLDIGCGEHGNLVHYLRKFGIEAFGIDRFTIDDPYLVKADWFDYKFEKQKWGTITSNLGFTNHFLHHHFRKDGDFIGYARKYMEILSSLKTNGSFLYAPSVPFIEEFLDRSLFDIKISSNEYGYSSVTIRKEGDS